MLGFLCVLDKLSFPVYMAWHRLFCTSLTLFSSFSISLGDHAVKAVGVIPEPEVKTFDLQESDQFMIMASDGVWEFITSQVNKYVVCF